MMEEGMIIESLENPEWGTWVVCHEEVPPEIGEDTANTQMGQKVSQSGGEMSYRLINQNCSSQKLGNCEVCGKWVSEVWFRTHEKPFVNGRHLDRFGHKECLEGKDAKY